MFSCRVPTIEEPVDSYVISLRRNLSKSGLRNLNIKDNPKKVGEWSGETVNGKLDNIPSELTCFSTEDWLQIIKPKLKEGARAYRDYRD